MPAVRDFLVRGLLAGLLAGFVAFGVAYAVGEPSLSAAVALEGPVDAAEVPRSLQATLGLLTGTVVAGTTLGGLAGVLSAVALGRFGRLGARASTLAVAGLGFVGVSLVPFLGYPPNPPGIGDANTIGVRTTLFLTLLVISLIALMTAVLVGRRLVMRIGGWYATLITGLGYLVVSAVAIALMPRYDEVPAGFPAGLLYDFRLASLATQLALWAVLGVGLAEAVHRLVIRPGDREPALTGVARP